MIRVQCYVYGCEALAVTQKTVGITAYIFLKEDYKGSIKNCSKYIEISVRLQRLCKGWAHYQNKMD